MVRWLEKIYNMKILITGGAGYIGTVLVDKLFKHYKNVEVTVYDNLVYKQTTLLNHCSQNNFRFVLGDVQDQFKLGEEVKKHDVIIPLAALVGAPLCERNKNLAYIINYDHIRYIISLLKPEQKIIYPNTNSGYGIGISGEYCTEESLLNPISVYGKTKCLAEYSVLKQGGIALRLATVFGLSSRMRLDLLVNDFVYKAISDKYIVLFEKDFKRNYIHVQDVASTFIYMIDNYEKLKGGVFNVGKCSLMSTDSPS